MSEKNLQDLAKSIKNGYHNEWQKQNRDKVKNAQDRYWQKKAKKILEEQKNKQDDERSNYETY